MRFLKDKFITIDLNLHPDLNLEYYITISPSIYLMNYALGDKAFILDKINAYKKDIFWALEILGLVSYNFKYNPQSLSYEILVIKSHNARMDLYEKFKRSLILLNNNERLSNNSISKEKVEKLQKALKEVYGLKNNGHRFKNRSYPVSFHWNKVIISNRQAYKKLLINKTQQNQLLNKEREDLKIATNLLIQGEFSDTSHIEITTCNFDNPDKMLPDTLYFGKYNNVIINFSSYETKNQLHFLITPTISGKLVKNGKIIDDVIREHPLCTQSWSHFHGKSEKELTQIMIELAQVLKTLDKNRHVSCFVQNGTSGGQTVAHTHMHVLLAPTQDEFCTQLATNFDKTQQFRPEFPIITPSRKQAIFNQVGPLLFQQLHAKLFYKNPEDKTELSKNKPSLKKLRF